MLITIILFIVMLLALVLSHEAGHFFSAKFFGIKVEEFGFGLPPRFLGIKKGGTIYSINWLPFGGFVKILGEDGDDGENTKNDQKNFSNRQAWVRAIVLVSGVAANFLLAFLLLSFVSWLGIPEAISDASLSGGSVAIVDIAPNSPAALAGIQVGDKIQTLESANKTNSPATIGDVQTFIQENSGKEITLHIKRGNEEIIKTVLARANPPPKEGALGIALELIRTKRTPLYLAPIEGTKMTWEISSSTIVGFWEIIKSLFKKTPLPFEVAGPVGIFNLTSSVANLGASSFLMFVAILSINLGIINVLPFPGLDGGRLLFVIIEKIRGKKISNQISSWVHGLGLALLILLMILITVHDISKIF